MIPQEIHKSIEAMTAYLADEADDLEESVRNGDIPEGDPEAHHIATHVARVDEWLASPPVRLEYLRGELRAERISYGELAELQGLAEHIAAGDVELLEAAGVPEEAAQVSSAGASGVKAIEVILIARDEQDAASINADIEQSGLLNNWPTFAWSEREATEIEHGWLKDEYDSALEEDDDPLHGDRNELPADVRELLDEDEGGS